jgi:adenylate cyclase
MAPNEVSFGRFRLDLRERMLSQGGVPVDLGKRALDILCVLASAKGEVVTNDELMARVWSGRVVEQNNIQVHVSALRKALGEGTNGESHVVTVPGRGYRLISLHSVCPGAAITEKPGIAVLPFQNMSGDPGQEYFADGVVEDIITALSRFSELFVIARNSSFKYKQRDVDFREVKRELGVRYILEGSVRHSNDRIRITAQLIDAETEIQLWAESYDRELKNIFAVQEDVARTIVALLTAHVKRAESTRTLLRPPATWQAYDYYMRAATTLNSFLSSFNVEELYETRRLLEQSISVDANYARATAAMSATYTFAWVQALDADHLSLSALDRGYQLARRAVQLDHNLPEAHSQLGNTLRLKGEHDASIAEFEKARVLNPNFTDWRFVAVLVGAGKSDEAIRIGEANMRLDPFYPPFAAGWSGLAFYMLKRYQEAIRSLREAVSRAPNWGAGHAWLAAALAQSGRVEEARAEAIEVLRINPMYTIDGTQRRVSVFRLSEDADHLHEGLCEAGLPQA